MQQTECRHYLELQLRQAAASATLWALCRKCRRQWFLGADAVKLAGRAARVAR
jgi:hypothetical protein